MAKIIEELQDEHKNIRQLLLILEQELSIFERHERPDYQVILAIINYFQDYPDVWHHPAEQIVLERLLAREPGLAESVGDLVEQHHDETEYLQRVAGAVESVLMDRELPRQEVNEVVRDFIAYQRTHMDIEESILFPAALETLRGDDWSEVETKLSEGRLALRNAAMEQGRQARERILQWERENEEQRI